MHGIVSFLTFVTSKQRSDIAALKIFKKVSTMKKVFEVKKIKTIPNGGFKTGTSISSNDYRQVDYWKGYDEIRQTKSKTYLTISGMCTVNGRKCYAEHLFEIINPNNNQLDIAGLNAVWYYDEALQFNGGIGKVVFSDNFDDLPQY